jgi:hypothetical protein
MIDCEFGSYKAIHLVCRICADVDGEHATPTAPSHSGIRGPE